MGRDATALRDEHSGSIPGRADSAAAEGELHLVVRAGAQRVALRMSSLRAVVAAPPVTRLPATDRSLVGVAALSGELVPVVDLAALVGIEAPARRAERLLVVVDDAGSPLAFKVDGVEGHESLRSPADFAGAAAAGGAQAVTAPARTGLVVLDIEAALADARLSPGDPHSGPRGKEHR